MPFHNNVAQLCQKALAAYVLSQNLSFLAAYAADEDKHVYTSVLDDTAATPNVFCKCSDADCVVDSEGNWRANADVELRENKDGNLADTHHEHAGELFALFATETKADDISAAFANFTAFQVIRKKQSWRIDGRLWVSSLRLEIDCCGSDIA